MENSYPLGTIFRTPLKVLVYIIIYNFFLQKIHHFIHFLVGSPTNRPIHWGKVTQKEKVNMPPMQAPPPAEEKGASGYSDRIGADGCVLLRVMAALVGGYNRPIWKNMSKSNWISSPGFGVKIKNLWVDITQCRWLQDPWRRLFRWSHIHGRRFSWHTSSHSSSSTRRWGRSHLTKK